MGWVFGLFVVFFLTLLKLYVTVPSASPRHPLPSVSSNPGAVNLPETPFREQSPRPATQTHLGSSGLGLTWGQLLLLPSDRGM